MILKKVLFILLLQLVLIESSNRIPGVDIVGCGFDATSLQSKQCLFDLEGKITEWTNPNDPSISFEVPNNLFIMDNPDSLSINGTTVFSSFNDFVQNSFWKTEEDDSGFLGFGARHETIEYSDYYTNMYSKYEKLALTLRQITWYTLKLRGYPKPKFSRIFQQALDYLPETFNDQSEVVFREFINAFGTHVVVKSDFGGLVYAQDWIEDCLFKMHDDLWIKDEVTIRYDPLGIFKKKSDSQTNITHNSQDFKYNSRHEVLLLGGTEKIPLDQWDQWVQTIKYNPKSINKKLFPLTYFLDDGPKKEALNQALKAYRSQADAEQKVYVSQLQQISPPPQSECYKEISTSFSFVQRKLFKLRSSDIIQRAKQNLCPFPGFHGEYCPDQQQSSSFAYKRQLQQGLRKMHSGVGVSFDITTGELMFPSIELTYQQNPSDDQIWKDEASGNQFIIADETKIEKVELKPDVKIYKDELELTSVWIDALQKGEWLGGEYSQAKDLTQVFEEFFKGFQQTSISQLSKNVIRISFKSDNLKLNEYAQQAVDSLPKEYSSEAYNEFIDFWGTHIAVDTHLGGMVEKQTIFKECVNASPSFTGGLQPDQIRQALENELTGNQADGFFVSRRKVSVDHKFGGDPQNQSNWEKTISENPAILKINKFIPWDSMVADDQVKANLQRAIKDRIESTKQKLQRLQEQITEQKKQSTCGDRPAYAVSGNGKGDNQDVKIRVTQFTLKDNQTCHAGLMAVDYFIQDECYSKDQDGNIEVLYERSNYKTRSCEYNAWNVENLNTYNTKVYNDNNWVDTGCSVVQQSSVHFDDFTQPPPDNSKFRMVCIGCDADVYNSPNGPIFQCNCPSF
ncbi:hypothetical protein ABPG73_007804 [Tetrahymena malaccensis]